MVDLWAGVTETDGGCDAFTKTGILPSDIDIASDKNDFCDDGDDSRVLFGKTLLFLAYDVELDGESVFVIVKLGVIFMLACELFKLAARISA